MKNTTLLLSIFVANIQIVQFKIIVIMPIPLIIPIALAAASAASSIYGASKSAAANRKAQRQLDAERAQTQAERARRMNEDYIDTAAGQNMLRVARREADKIWKREQGTAAMTGATERAAMAKEYGNNMVGEAVANIAASDQQRKDNIDASYRAEERALAQQQIANEQQKGQIIAQAAAGVGSALMQAAGATFGGTKLGQSMMGNGSPGGSNVAPQGNTSTTTINDVGSTSTIPTTEMQIADYYKSRQNVSNIIQNAGLWRDNWGFKLNW